MLNATKEKPVTVVIVVSSENEESQTRYIAGKTVAQVCAELFGEKPVKERKARKPRTPKEKDPELPPANEPAPGETVTKTEKPHRRIMPE